MESIPEICFYVADKLKDPEKVFSIAETFRKRKLNSIDDPLSMNLANGLPGLCLFFGVLDQINPSQDWDKVAHRYLQICLNEASQKGFNGLSLFEGLTGLCYTVYVSSKEGTRYHRLIERLESQLTQQLEYAFMRESDKILMSNEPISSNFYNISNGIAGIILYLLLRKTNPDLYRLTANCVFVLVRLLKQKKIIKGKTFPAWYVAPNHQLSHQGKEKYPEGSFNLSSIYGIVGCLSVLSLAFKEGITVSGQYEMILEISDWIKALQVEGPTGYYWPHTISAVSKEGFSERDNDLRRDVWYCGTPAVARSLFLAAQATQNELLTQFSLEAFLSIFKRSQESWNMMGTSLIWGRAGMLAITTKMSHETNHKLLEQQVRLQREELLPFYNERHPFGFQTLYIDESNGYQWVDHPGLLDGAAGTALALIMNQTPQNSKWNLLLL